MRTPGGDIELDRTVESFYVDRHHPTDLNDIGVLTASVKWHGL